MFRTALEVVLLAAASVLLIGGIAAYPDIPGWMLGCAVAVAALMVAPVGAGHRAEESAPAEEVAR